MWYALRTVDGLNEIVWVEWFLEEPTSLNDFLYPNRREFALEGEDTKPLRGWLEIIRVEITPWLDRSYEFRQSGDNSWYE